MTEEQRIAVIAKAVENSKSTTPSQPIEEFIAEIKTEQVVTEHGLLDAQKEDLADESQFLFTDSAEDIDEEDEDMGISDQMKGIYNAS
jgi:hypothetical protein